MDIPVSVKKICQELKDAGHEAFLVGGCVRDYLEDKEPADWDIATNALPKQIQTIFPDSFYENRFGTVGIKNKEVSSGLVEVTTYRREAKYSDRRHPDQVTFSKTLKDDLNRRDFTVNAMALDCLDPKETIIDPFKGQKDLQQKIIRCVGSPQKRFREDALRLLRAARFATQLNFSLEEKTLAALKANAALLEKISQERIRDELKKIILSSEPAKGIDLLEATGLLKFVIPELTQGIGVSQNRHHIHSVYQHSLLSLKYCPSPKLSVRLAALLHDIAKPQTKRGEGVSSTFYNHDLVGSRLAQKILRRLRFSNKVIEKTSLLIKNHMFYYEVDSVTPSSVRRLITKVGPQNMQDLMDLRIADRLGSGCPKAKPYKLRHLEYLVDKVSKDPISVKMLKVDGHDLKTKAQITPGPQMGAILEFLLSEVLDDPQKNTTDYLLKRAKELKDKKPAALKRKAAPKIEERKIEEDKVLKKKHWVQ